MHAFSNLYQPFMRNFYRVIPSVFLNKCIQTFLLFIGSFQVTAQSPVISSFTPVSATAGSVITINGSNFSTAAQNNIVYFGGVQAPVINASGSMLTVTVPSGSSCQRISVTNLQNNLTAYSRTSFIPTFSPNNSLVKLKTGDLMEQSPVALDMGAGCSASGDLDNDGKPDMAVINSYGNTVSVYKNLGNQDSIAFGEKFDLTAGQGPLHISFADMNGDGKLDMIVVSSISQNVFIFKNISTGSGIAFAPPVTLDAGRDVKMSAINDFDGDGKPDIAVGNGGFFENKVTIIQNLSTVNDLLFAVLNNRLTVGRSPFALVSGDFNNDGKPEIATANYDDNSITVYRNNSSVGNIIFDVQLTYSAGINPVAIAMGEFDRRDFPDLVVANYNGDSLTVLRNSSSSVGGNVSFQKRTVAAANGIVSLAVCDLDGDGRSDVVGLNDITDSFTVFRNSALLTGILDVKLSATASYFAGNNASYISASDLNNDNKPDIIISNDVDNSFRPFRNMIFTGAPLITSVSPLSAAAGEPVTIRGEHLSGISKVSFGGTAAENFAVRGDSVVIASVGTGASGYVRVSTEESINRFGSFKFNSAPEPVRIITTIAGNGTVGYGGDTVAALQASFRSPYNLCIDTVRNYLYIHDYLNYRIRRMNLSTGIITNFAGNGIPGFSGDGGLATAAQIFNLSAGAITLDRNGNLYLADIVNNRVRKVDISTGIINTIAGGGTGSADTDAVPATSVQLFAVSGIAFDTSGKLYIADSRRLRRLDTLTGLLYNISATALAGSYADSIPVNTAIMLSINNIVIDNNNNIYLGDISLNKIRRIDAVTGMVTTVAGTDAAGTEGDGGLAVNATVLYPAKLTLDKQANALYFSETGSNVNSIVINRVRKIDLNTGIINTIAGGNVLPAHSGDGGDALIAELAKPVGIVCGKDGELYVCEVDGYIRKISAAATGRILCPGENATITTDLVGTNYQWQVKSDTVFSDAVEGINLAGVQTAALQLINTPSSWNGYIFRCVTDGNAGKPVVLKFENSWTGAINSNWENIGNWSCNILPDAGTDVIINNGNVVISSNAICRTITVKPGASVVINPGFNLTVVH